MTTNLILDCNNILWMCYHAQRRAREISSQEQRTKNPFEGTVLSSFLTCVMSYQRRLWADRTVFCWDLGRPLRKEFLYTYKERKGIRAGVNYTSDKERVRDLADLLRTDLLPSCGYKNIFAQDGMEADDMIAAAAENLDIEKHEGVIVTSDQDMYQVLREHVTIWNPITQCSLTFKMFVDKYGIAPTFWWKVKALGGCESDSIRGIEGVGETRALHFVQGKRCRDSIVERKLLTHHDEVLERNAVLVKLPFPGTVVPKIKKDRITRRKWIKTMERFEMGRLKLILPAGVDVDG